MIYPIKIRGGLLRKFFLGFLFLQAFCFASGDAILREQMSSKDRRYVGFSEAFRLMDERGARVIAETGCDLDGAQPGLFAAFAKENGGRVYVVDPSKEGLRAAKLSAGSNVSSLECFCEDPVMFLRNFPFQIDLLYLDSVKFFHHDPGSAQRYHLEELKAALPHFGPNTIVMIDDCGLSGGGRGKLVIEYLISKGWKIVSHTYQVILVQE